MAPALIALVFGFNIKPIHSAVDMGNESTAACELFCIVSERLTISKNKLRWRPAKLVIN